VCTAQGFTDSDPRYGFVTGRIFFGPNQKDGFVDESVLWGYRLSFIDDCGADLAEIGKVGKRDYPPAICCDPERYSFGLEGVPVPAGATAIQIAPYKEQQRHNDVVVILDSNYQLPRVLVAMAIRPTVYSGVSRDIVLGSTAPEYSARQFRACRVYHHHFDAQNQNQFGQTDGRNASALLQEEFLQSETASVRLLRDADALEAEMKEATKSQHEEMNYSKLQLAALREELLSAHDHVRGWRQERDSEAEAASVTNEAYLAESRSSLRQHESLRAEARTRLSEVASMEDFQRSLDGQAKVLQNELSKVAYSIGQRDHELKVKDSELQEVRENLSGIQDEMDEVNSQLKVQCQRVQRVERELSLSSDLGEKVKNMRLMLQESHSGIAQLCALVNQERQKRDQYTQGLKQQRLRTELLLQLLHHFKNRTQELAPQSLPDVLAPSSGVDAPQEPMTPQPRAMG
ncbi:unnamed protein product, partial [Cladocopium goreaui]